MKEEGPKVFKLVNSNSSWIFSKIIPPWLVPQGVLFLVTSKASCFNYYKNSLVIGDFKEHLGCMMLPFTEYLPNIKRELLFRKVSSAPNENNSSHIIFRVAFEADKLASKTNPV